MLSPSQTENKVIAIYREPMKLGTPEVEAWPRGCTVLDIVGRMKCLPKQFVKYGVVRVNDVEVPFDQWATYVPDAYTKDYQSFVTFHMAPQGGGKKGKGIFGIIAALALTVLTAGIGSGVILPTVSATLGAALGIGAAGGAALLAAGVSIVGGLLIRALTAPPVRDASSPNSEKADKSLESASLSGNTLEPNAAIPRVCGTRRLFPPFAFEPIVEIQGQDEIVNAVYVLAGPHDFSDYRIGNTSVQVADSDADLVINAYDGRPGSFKTFIPNRQGRTYNLGFEMSVQGFNPDDLARYAPPSPVFHGMGTPFGPDECWLHMMLFGLLYQTTPSAKMRIPFRVRMRRRGDPDWRYLPEFHYINATQQQTRLQIKFLFRALTGSPAAPPQTVGFLDARKHAPGQTDAPAQPDFDCDPYFSAGAGNDVFNYATRATTNVRNMELASESVTFYLDPASWPSGQYEIEIKRGALVRDSTWNTTNYTVNSSIFDLFGFKNTGLLPFSRDGVMDRISLTRFVSIRNQAPVLQKDLAYITIQARNRSVDQLSVKASGIVADYNPATGLWNEYHATSNPAAHYRDALIGSLNFDPLPSDLVDDEALAEWWQSNVDNDRRCDIVFEGTGLADVLRLLASCGYAQPYQSELWGVIRDYDRSAESPIQIFTGRNLNNFSWRKVFSRLPSGFLISYTDEDYEYTTQQITVYRKDANESDARLEQTAYEGLTRVNDIIERASFDLRQAALRGAVYSFDAPAEYLRCRRGSLVGVNHDILTRQYGSARIVEVILNGSGDVAGIVVDDKFDVFNNLFVQQIPVVQQVPVMQEVGLQTSVAIRLTDGSTQVFPISGSAKQTDTLMFTTPVPNDTATPGPFDSGTLHKISDGCLVAIGIGGKEFKRMIVTGISPSSDLTANLTLVDEAPELWSA